MAARAPSPLEWGRVRQRGARLEAPDRRGRLRAERDAPERLVPRAPVVEERLRAIALALPRPRDREVREGPQLRVPLPLERRAGELAGRFRSSRAQALPRRAQARLGARREGLEGPEAGRFRLRLRAPPAPSARPREERRGPLL